MWEPPLVSFPDEDGPMRSRLFAAGFLAASLLVATKQSTPVPPPVGTPATPEQQFGLNTHFVLDDSSVDAEMAELSHAGITGVREDFRWSIIEPTRGVFEWSITDKVMAAAARNKIAVLPILAYSTPWSSSDPTAAHDAHYPPQVPQDYADFAAAVVARYGTRGTFWRPWSVSTRVPISTVELWNEPNIKRFWAVDPDPEKYAELARTAAKAIKSVKPLTKVIVCGDLLQSRTSHVITPWLDEFLSAAPDLSQWADGLSVHPYPNVPSNSPLDDTPKPQYRFAVIPLIAAVEKSHHISLPIWITEIGWSTQGTYAIMEAQQAQYLLAAGERSRHDWPSLVVAFYAFSWDKSTGLDADSDSGYGVRRLDGTFKPAWNSVVTLARQALA